MLDIKQFARFWGQTILILVALLLMREFVLSPFESLTPIQKFVVGLALFGIAVWFFKIDISKK